MAGRLISTDFSAGVVHAAQRGAATRELRNVTCRVMDAQALGLADASVDGVLSRFGLMLVPDPGQAIGEAHRVLRPGGRLAYAVWGAIDRNPWITVLVGALIQIGHAPGGDPFGPGGLFSLSDPERNTKLAQHAGFIDIDVAEMTGAMDADNLEDYWNCQTSISGPVAAVLASLPQAEQDEVRDAFRAEAEPYRTPVGYRFPTCAVVLQATR